jgi:hypothetical protein
LKTNSTLAKVLEAISNERSTGFNESFRLVATLVNEYGENEISERVLRDSPRSVQLEILADLLNILAWQAQDNGTAIQSSAESWLVEATDVRKVTVALALEVYPFRELAQMESAFEILCAKMPEVTSRCLKLIEMRKIDSQKQSNRPSIDEVNCKPRTSP